MIINCVPADVVLMTNFATGFQSADLDTSGNLISCLETIDSYPFFREVKRESFQLLEISPGYRVLDVGCGTGADARRIVEYTGTQGLVVGIDIGRGMIEKAAGVGMDEYCQICDDRICPSFIRMDGRYLGFSDETFHAVREDRALQHIAHAEEVIHEMFRVLRTGGRFVIFEPDWELFIIAGSERGLTRRILNFWNDQFMNGWIGRSLYRMCLDCGAHDITILPRTMILHDLTLCNQIFGIQETIELATRSGIILPEEAVIWLSYVQHADTAGHFFCSFTGYLVYGRKG
jgi:ubiquinone/menaquinone biosynthesis C-methylase UbiE